MKNEKYNYYTVSSVKSEMKIRFDNLREFARFLDNHNIRALFSYQADGEPHPLFAATHKGGLLEQSSMGFASIEDFQKALQRGFSTAEDYYGSLELGSHTTSAEDYLMLKNAGITDKEKYNEIKDKGYMDGFAKYKTMAEKPGPPIIWESANSLFEYSKVGDFSDFKEMEDALLKGFNQQGDYLIAMGKEYKTAQDYEEGQAGGYINGQEYYIAKDAKALNRKDFLRYIDLFSLNLPELTADEKVLIILLSKLPENKRVSVSKIEELHKTAIKEYLSDEGTLPPWFTSKLEGRKEYIEFFANCDVAKKYGIWDADGEFLETKTLQARKVVIDASNVAHNSKNGVTTKPLLKNIIRLVEELKLNGFIEIKALADASLKHKIADPELMPQLKELIEYTECPAETPADIFIIGYVKRVHCLLVSNDTFKEWKLQDPWVAHNIDYYRLTFMINSDSVILPDVQKK